MTTADDLAGLIDERPDAGLFRVHRRMFTDEAIFELEMKYIFESNWVYVCHESQIPEPHDYITTVIGRQPVIINRNRDGGLGGFINSCRHRGAVVELMSRGNKKVFKCPFHGWCYNSSGDLVDCGDNEKAGYGPGFDKRELGLTPLPRVASYRGFVFASLSDAVVPLETYLGGAARCLDLIVDQDPDGRIEVLPGQQVYTFDGNWKLQAENGVDGYHVDTIHANYVETVRHRQQLRAQGDAVNSVDVGAIDRFPGGFYAFENGHVMLWNEWPNPQVRPAYASREAYEAAFGAERARWMTSYLRNLLIYPNVFFMDQMSTQIRVFRPLAVDKTEVRTVCFAPASESAAARTSRIRQYEDFFNASGMATPDDLAAFNASQAGFDAGLVEWNDVSRGAMNLVDGADDHARAIGLEPRLSGGQLQDEGIFLWQHRHWLNTLRDGLANDSDGQGRRDVA
ncbi:MAG: SRPBCC family protein [Gammaproteobacteria bacterium]